MIKRLKKWFQVELKEAEAEDEIEVSAWAINLGKAIDKYGFDTLYFLRFSDFPLDYSSMKKISAGGGRIDRFECKLRIEEEPEIKLEGDGDGHSFSFWAGKNWIKLNLSSADDAYLTQKVKEFDVRQQENYEKEQLKKEKALDLKRLKAIRKIEAWKV